MYYVDVNTEETSLGSQRAFGRRLCPRILVKNRYYPVMFTDESYCHYVSGGRKSFSMLMDNTKTAVSHKCLILFTYKNCDRTELTNYNMHRK